MNTAFEDPDTDPEPGLDPDLAPDLDRGPIAPAPGPWVVAVRGDMDLDHVDELRAALRWPSHVPPATPSSMST